MLLVRLTLWATAIVIVAASLSTVPVGVYVLFTEGGSLGGALFLTAILAALGVGGPYVGYLLVRTSRRLRSRGRSNLGHELGSAALWVLIVFVAALVAPLPGDPSVAARAAFGVLCALVGVIGVAHEMERESEGRRQPK